LGRAGSAAQTLLIAAVAAGLVWVLLRVSVVVVALLVALILAAAVAPAVKWLERRGWSNLLATLAAFVGILVLVGGILAGIVFSVRSEWGTLTAQAVEGWDELQRFITTGRCPSTPSPSTGPCARSGSSCPAVRWPARRSAESPRPPRSSPARSWSSSSCSSS
jgi:hypothetical protein